MKQTATKKTKPQKKTTKTARPQAQAAEPQDPEVLPAVSDMLSTAPDRSETDAILGIVRQDIANAEVGRFFALRAGVGLVVVREMCAHGEWSQEMLRMIPDRSPRTLRRYMDSAREFLDSQALLARDVWPKLASVGNSALGAAAERLMIGDGSETAPVDPDGEVPDEVRAMADFLRGCAADKEKEETASARKLSPAAKRLAAQGLWQTIAGRVVDEGIKRGSWQLLDAETLETVASAFRTVADKMMAATRKAAKQTGNN